MREILTEISLESSLERVWEVLTDFARYAEWNPLIVSARGTLAVGARVQMTIRPPGLVGRSFQVTLLEVEPPRRLRWLGRLGLPGLLDGEHLFALEPLGRGRVRLVQSERFRGILVPLLAPLLLPNMRRGFELSNAACRARAARHAPDANRSEVW